MRLKVMNTIAQNYNKIIVHYMKTTGEDPQFSTFSTFEKIGILCLKTSVAFDFKYF